MRNKVVGQLIKHLLSFQNFNSDAVGPRFMLKHKVKSVWYNFRHKYNLRSARLIEGSSSA